MITNTEKNIAIGAAIGIVSAMASARIAAANNIADDEKVSEDARIIASTMLGTDVPDTDEAIVELVKAFDDEQLMSDMTFGDVVKAIEQSNEAHSKTVSEAVSEAEKSVSPDIVSLNHIDAHTDKLVAMISEWTEMDYEHERIVSSIPRPNYAEALAQARANGIKVGYYDANGGISEAHIEKLRQELRAEKEKAEQKAEQVEDDDAEDVDAVVDAEQDVEEDTFFSDIVEKISSPIGDEVGERETGEFEAVHASNADEPSGDTQADEPEDETLDTAAEEEGNEEDDGFSAQATQELPPVEIPPKEVLEILEPEPVKDPTGPIVMDPNEVVEAIAEEAAESVDDEVVAGVVEDMAEEMIEAAELDPEECKSFTDEFMAIEIGADGKARPKQQSDEDDNAADDDESDKEKAFASLYDVEEDAKKAPPADIQEGAEEILGIASKTREAIKRAMKSAESQ